MLDELLAELASPAEENHFVALESIEFVGRNARLALRITYDTDERTVASWDLMAHDLRGLHVSRNDGQLLFHPHGHVASRQYTDPACALYFRGTESPAPPLIGSLYVAHREAAGPWIRFERYLNSRTPLDRLFRAGRYVLLADGPSFLIDAYEAVLRDNGIESDRMPPRPARHFDGSQWTETERPLATLIVGDSWFVAAGFEAAQRPGEK